MSNPTTRLVKNGICLKIWLYYLSLLFHSVFLIKMIIIFHLVSLFKRRIVGLLIHFFWSIEFFESNSEEQLNFIVGKLKNR